MATRRSDLCKVADNAVVGAVQLDDAGGAAFERLADDVFAPYRRRLGDDTAAALLLDEGWSNGYVYLTVAAVISE